MQALRIVVVLCAFGLGHSTPVQSDGIKSAGSVGIKGHDGTTKYAFEDPQKISSPGQVVRVQSGSVGWQSPTADVVPSQVEAHQDGQYVPVINVKPSQKVEWISPAMKKQYVGEEVFEQRKEEPVMVSSYEPIIGPQMSSDPYREILPEVIHGKRRLGEEDVPVSVHSEVSPFSGSRMVSVSMFGKAPVKQYVYGEKSVPQHGYTEDSFPSIITLKGRQYLVVPHKTGSQIQPYYASSTVPYPFSWESHSDYVPSVQQQSQVYQSVPVRDVGGQQVVKQGHIYGLLPVSQTLTGQSVHTVPSTSFVPQQQSPGQSGGYVVVPPASSSLPSPNYERPVSVVSTGIQSDYSPYVQPITQKVPYFSPYWYTHPQVYATKYSAYVPQVQVPKTQVVHSPVTQSSWGWVSAPQYISKEVVRPGSWVVKGVRKGEVFGDVPAQYDVRGASGVKTWVRSVDSEQKTKWYSPSVKQAPGKGWYIYSPISPAPWSYGVPQQSFGGAPSVSAWAPQYGGQWEVPEGGKVVAPSQWSGPAAGEQWSVKQGQQPVSQGVSYVPSFGQKIKSVPAVPEAAGYQGSAVHSGLHYAVEINHGPSGSASIQQAPQVGSEVVSEQHGTKSGSVQAQAPIDQSS